MEASVNIQDIVDHTIRVMEHEQQVEKTVLMTSVDINEQIWLLVKTAINGKESSTQWVNSRFFESWYTQINHMAMAS